MSGQRDSVVASTAMEDFVVTMQRFRERADSALERCLPDVATPPARLHQAMHYAVISGGKRVRPILVYATGQALQIPLERLDGAACAVELMHAYSLVHDDLPAMDDDDLRRGQPTCHKRFDEATAILAGDALQALAYEILGAGRDDSPPDDGVAAQMIRVLAKASGSHGMAGGQAIDLASVGARLSLDELENMHRLKTGALFRACVELAALNQQPRDDALGVRLDRYAAAIGLAFQITDDILDVIGDTTTLGKTQGADLALDKPTYPSTLTLQGAREHAEAMHDQAIASLDGLGHDFDVLRQLSAFVIQRTY